MMVLPEPLVNVLAGLEPVAQHPSVLVLLGVCIPFFIFPALARFLPKRLVSLLTGREPFPGIPMTKNARLVSGHSYLFALNFRETWKKLTERSNADGFSSFWMGWKPVCVVTNLENARKILIENTAKSATKHTKHMKMFVGKTAVVFSEGDMWEPRHVIFKETLADTLGTIHKPIHDVASKITASLLDGLPEKGGSPMNGHVLAKNVFSAIVGNVFLNFKFDEETSTKATSTFLGKKDPVASFLLENVPLLTHLCQRSNWNPMNYFYFLSGRNRQFLKNRAAVRKAIMDVVKQETSESADQGSESGAFIRHLVMAARAAGDMASEEDLVGFVMTAYFGSLDTTSNTLEYVLYHLSKAPDVVEKCLGEIAALKKIKKVEDINPNDCVYLTAVVNETLRMHPIAVSAWRTLKDEMTLGKTTIPAGTQIYFPLHHIAHNVMEQSGFNPDRWVKPSASGSGWEKSSLNPNDFSNLVAFSHGRRSCPGKNLARKGLITLLVHLLPAIKVELDQEDYVPKPALDGVVQCPEGGVPLKLSRRV